MKRAASKQATSDRASGSRLASDHLAMLRWMIYGLLIAISAGGMLARIVQVRNISQKNPSPFLSANDRSRWCTIRALVDDGTYSIDHIMFREDGSRDPKWHSIDVVKHRASDGREHYYSSKPTLYTSILAGNYWLIKQLTGATLAKETFYVARIILVMANVIPLLLALVLLARLLEYWGTANLDRLLIMAVACFGTFLTTFSITLNNHLPAAITLIFTLAAARPMLEGTRAPWWRFLLTGLFAAATFANELPALSMVVLLGAVLLVRDWKMTLAGYVPAFAIVVAGMFGTNILAHGDWRTPYAHRSDGVVLSTLDDTSFSKLLDAGKLPAELLAKANEVAETPLSGKAQIEQRTASARWVLWDEPTQQRFAIVQSADGKTIELRQWDHWYDYDGTYWTADRLQGVDRGEPSRLVYFFHCTLGHHGLFSLSSVWIISLVGAMMWLSSGNRMQQAFAASTLLLTIVCLGFYISRPLIDRNYGGVCCCLRWMIWLTPLWLVVMFPALGTVEKRPKLAILVFLLVAASVFSAQYAGANPWSHPWIYDYWMQLGWLRP